MMMLTDENHAIVDVALIPGAIDVPEGWHCYFPVVEQVPNIGARFVPDLDKQPWLTYHLRYRVTRSGLP